MQYMECFVPTCRNDSINSPDKLFVRLREDLKKEWCRCVNANYYPIYLMYCCEDHLDPREDLKNYYKCKLMNETPILKPTAKLRHITNQSHDKENTNLRIENIQNTQESELMKLLLKPVENIVTESAKKRKFKETYMPSTSSLSTLPVQVFEYNSLIMDANNIYFIGVDVGSGSVRAALVDEQGHILKLAVKTIHTWKPIADYYEQSSNDIWNCCLNVIKTVVANVDVNQIRGIGFDATCSLVVLDANGNPVSISDSNNKEQNIIMWMDHRAQAEADLINKSGHEILKYVGGKVSLEMEIPKILWLKNNFPERWNEYGLFFDLPDFLTWKATGSLSRSLCSLVCKWNYECSTEGTRRWNVDFLNKIGLGDLCNDNFRKIGNNVLVPGEPCGTGLSPEAAEELGLLPSTPVATSIIDAHAGGLGMIGTYANKIDKEMPGRLSLICGTSNCHMAVNNNPILVQGIWGPYFSAMVPNMWLNEAGQSASGMLLDHIICNHPAGQELLRTSNMGEVLSCLRKLLSQMANDQQLSDISLLTRDFHMWPDFHGNRSPLADPTLKGMLIGLTINNSKENLAILYLATVQALAYGTRHIINSLISAGYEPFKSLLICGGLSQDPLFVQIQADSVGLPVLQPKEKNPVLVGAAILGACASQHFSNVNDAINKMGGTADVVWPKKNIKKYHDKKYKVFLKMLEDQLEYRNMMC